MRAIATEENCCWPASRYCPPGDLQLRFTSGKVAENGWASRARQVRVGDPVRWTASSLFLPPRHVSTIFRKFLAVAIAGTLVTPFSLGRANLSPGSDAFSRRGWSALLMASLELSSRAFHAARSEPERAKKGEGARVRIQSAIAWYGTVLVTPASSARRHSTPRRGAAQHAQTRSVAGPAEAGLARLDGKPGGTKG